MDQDNKQNDKENDIDAPGILYMLWLDKNDTYYQALMDTLNEGCNYFQKHIRGALTTAEFEEASSLLKAFQSAKKVLSKIQKQIKKEKETEQEKASTSVIH